MLHYIKKKSQRKQSKPWILNTFIQKTDSLKHVQLKSTIELNSVNYNRTIVIFIIISSTNNIDPHEFLPL